MKESKLWIKYKVNGEIREEESYQTVDYSIEETCTSHNVKLVISPKKEIELIAAELQYQRPVKNGERFFVNGYQAWTTSREVTIDDKQKGLTPLTKFTKTGFELAALSGDYGFVKYPALAKMFSEKGLEEVTGLKWNSAAAKIKAVYEDAINEVAK